MPDTTQAQPPVESTPTVETLESTLENIFAGQPEPPKQEAQAEQQDVGAESPEELSPDDLPEGEDEATKEAATDDAFEIVHNGQTVKLSRDEATEYARKGFDYDRKTQALAEKSRTVEATLQRVSQIEQFVPFVAQEMAAVKALEGRLQQFSQEVEKAGGWVALASNPETVLEYPKYQAQFQQLQSAYQAAVGQYQQKVMAVSAERQQIAAQRVQEQTSALMEMIPEWRDPAKYQAGAKELADYLVKEGYPAEIVGGIDTALYLKTARKAMLYDRLKSLKADKAKQIRSAPPVVKPGAVNPSDPSKAQFQKARQEIRKAGREGNHRLQEDAMVGLLNRTFKK